MANDSNKTKKGVKLETAEAEGTETSDLKVQDPASSLAGVHSTGVTVEDLEVAFEDLVVSYARVLGPGVRVRITIEGGTTKQDNLRELLVRVVLRVGKKKKAVMEGCTIGAALRLMLNAEGARWTHKQRKKQSK